MSDFERFRFVRGKIDFYKRELSSLKQRMKELNVEMLNQKQIDPRIATAMMGLDEITAQTYENLIKNYEDIILVLEVMAQIPQEERLP